MREEPQGPVFPGRYRPPRFNRLPPGQHLAPAGPEAEVGPESRALRAGRRSQPDALPAHAQAVVFERRVLARIFHTPMETPTVRRVRARGLQARTSAPVGRVPSR